MPTMHNRITHITLLKLSQNQYKTQSPAFVDKPPIAKKKWTSDPICLKGGVEDTNNNYALVIKFIVVWD